MKDLEIKLKELSLALYNIGALKFGEFKLKSGMSTPIYFDLRLVVSYPNVLDLLTNVIIDYLHHLSLKPPLICGVPYTALPMASCVSLKSKIPMCVRRKEPKSYGTMNQIDGIFKEGDECLVIEDVVTSGQSIFETVQDLKTVGLVVTDVIVVLDRGQGGKENLESKGIKMHYLLNSAKILDYLLREGCVTQEVVDKVHEYISTNRSHISSDEKTKRLSLPFDERVNLAYNDLTKKLFNLMLKKKSNLCVAVDVKSSEELLTIAREVGEHVCLIKTHFDAVIDWSSETEDKLMELSQKYDFMIMEDRKYGDIGKTVSLQCSKVFKWAELVTMHSVAGPGSVEGAVEAAKSFSTGRGVFLVGQLSSKGNLISSSYTQSTFSMAQQRPEIVVGIVGQVAEAVPDPGLIQLTPGVSLGKEGDSLGQQYVSPEVAVLSKGGDIIVVGRAVTESPSPSKEAATLKEKLWSAYLQRLSM